MPGAPTGESFSWSASRQTALAYGFDPSTMLISPLPGAGTGGGFAIPLYLGPTFSFVDPDLMYGVLKSAPLTIANFRYFDWSGNAVVRHHDMRNATAVGGGSAREQ